MIFWVNMVVVFQNLRGIINGAQVALGLQKKVIVPNFVCSWILNFGFLYWICFEEKIGAKGIFMSKFVTD